MEPSHVKCTCAPPHSRSLFMSKRSLESKFFNLKWCWQENLLDHVMEKDLDKFRSNIFDAKTVCTCPKDFPIEKMCIITDEDLMFLFKYLGDCLASGRIQEL